MVLYVSCGAVAGEPAAGQQEQRGKREVGRLWTGIGSYEWQTLLRWVAQNAVLVIVE